jgi:outer membrane protein, heavy metal efflux system
MMQSRLLLNQTRLLASGAKKSAAEARAGLASALGLSTEQVAGARFDFSAAMNPRRNLNPGRLRCSAYTERPDVLAALADYAAAEAALRLEIAKQYPDLRLGPGYEFDQGLNKWTLGFSLTLPVFDRNQGPIAEAEAKRAAMAAKFQVLEAKVAGDLDRALVSYRGALEKLLVAGETIAVATKQRDAAQHLLQGGEGDRLAVLAAQVELDAALSGRLDVLVEVQQALAGLEDAARIALEP